MKPLRFIIAFFALLGLTNVGSAEDFHDVDPTHPFYFAIAELADQNVVQGYETGVYTEFFPLNEVNRAEAIKMITLVAEVPIEMGENVTQTFPDVSGSAWFNPFVRRGVGQKIINGYDDGYFRPERPVSRAEMVKMASIAFKAPIDARLAEEEWFTPFMNWAQEANVLPSSTLPHENLTRGEVAEILYRTWTLKNEGFVRAYVFQGKGIASYYHPSLAGNPTATGEPYNPQDLTAAHRTLPFGTRVKLTANGKSVVVRINDRGPYHENRIIDLSEAAFEALSPFSAGIVKVHMEVLPETTAEVLPEVPEAIAGALDLATQENEVPEAILAYLDDPDIPKQVPKPFDFEAAEKRNVPSVNGDFFETFTLREPFTTEVLAGTYKVLYGRAVEYGNTDVTGVLFHGETQTQTEFKGEISGKNFVIPVFFQKPGKYTFGVFFNDGGRTKVTTMTVLPADEEQKPPSAETFDGTYDVFLNPLEESMTIKWTPQASDVITRFEFTGNVQQKIFIDADESEMTLPFSFFEAFDDNKPVEIELSYAKSPDGAQHHRRTNWRRAEKRAYTFVRTLPPQYNGLVPDMWQKYANLGETIDVKVENIGGQDLKKDAFVILPSGEVAKVPFYQNGNAIITEMLVSEAGPYVFTLSNTEGLTVFLDVIHVRPQSAWVLPVLPWKYADVPKDESPQGILWWVNGIRKANGRNILKMNQSINNVAQDYASQMANMGFISHTAPDGTTLLDRVRPIGLGQFGENIGFGTHFDLMLTSMDVSASHRLNILDAKWNEVGIGLAFDKDGSYYMVIVFGV